MSYYVIEDECWLMDRTITELDTLMADAAKNASILNTQRRVPTGPGSQRSVSSEHMSDT